MRFPAPGHQAERAGRLMADALPEPMGAENLCHLGRCSGRAQSRVQCRASRSRAVRTCDDLRLVGLKLIFLAISSAMSLLRLSRREDWWKDAEILMLRHRLAVALRERPRAAAGLTWPDRAWLALLAGTLPIDRLGRIRLIVTPATILRWHRDIVHRRWARRSRRGRSGRPPVRRDVRSVVLRLARENESWDAGISPAPRRDGPGWAEFLRSQAQAMLALDFFTADLLNGTKVYVLACCTTHDWIGCSVAPIQSWVVQQARNLLMDLEDAKTSMKFVLHD